MPDNETLKTKRQSLTERMQSRYPDMDFSDDEQLFGRIYEDYADYDERGRELEGYRERESKFADMFTSDPRSARLMNDWRNGDDPAVALVRLYGTDITDAINDPEKQDEIAKANREYMDRVAKEKEYEQQYSDNLAKSLATLEEVQQQRGLSDDDIDAAMEWIITIAKDAMLGKFTPEVIDMAIKAQNFDSAVEQASREGEVLGRNARIEEKLRKPSRGDGTPMLDGKNGGRSKSPAPDLGAIDRYGEGNMTIFERGGERRHPVKR